MTDLYDRLFPTDNSENISVHAFHAAIVDYMAGETVRSQIISTWSLDAEATADLDILLAAVDALNKIEDKLKFIGGMDAVNILAAEGLKYTTKSSYRTRLNL